MGGGGGGSGSDVRRGEGGSKIIFELNSPLELFKSEETCRLSDFNLNKLLRPLIN